ncbi:sec-independent protein translocase protein TatB [Enhydrobacter aerosaccus]|uniref:Sec-independent protein translocase protein TatB n=1 Tax=Enhydrobacter aerosaccus TaxID=225324 RepID=A0A1T4TH69_9HYPH|nr:Sec-independent protein translocase protein TatB [Enhydrobacter aerosaccus]SKA39792.1 sec-independent protein translocase protein TatB [Enhydrobacter aerosaccus]
MFGIDSPELLVIAVVALVVIGPKELPGLLRTWGKWMAQMRGMASEFRGHVDEMVRQSELDEVKKQLEAATGGVDLKSLDPTKQIRSAIQEGMAEGEKTMAEAKSALANPLADNPLAEPESAPQVAAEPAPQLTADTTPVVAPPAEPAPIPEAPIPEAPVAHAPAPETPTPEVKPVEAKPATKAAAE